MSDLKKTWQDLGDKFNDAFTDLGKTLIKTVAEAGRKAEEWANSKTGENKENQQSDSSEENK